MFVTYTTYTGEEIQRYYYIFFHNYKSRKKGKTVQYLDFSTTLI